MLCLQSIHRRHNRSTDPIPNRNYSPLASVHRPDCDNMDLGAPDNGGVLSLQYLDLPIREQRHPSSRVSYQWCPTYFISFQNYLHSAETCV